MNVSIDKIWYNPAQSAFEGRIDISRHGQTYRYPCEVRGPMDMSDDDVREQMKIQARRMTDTQPTVFSHV